VLWPDQVIDPGSGADDSARCRRGRCWPAPIPMSPPQRSAAAVN